MTIPKQVWDSLMQSQQTNDKLVSLLFNQQQQYQQDLVNARPAHLGTQYNPIVINSPRKLKHEVLSQEAQGSTGPETPKPAKINIINKG